MSRADTPDATTTLFSTNSSAMPLWWRLALRDLKTGLPGFAVFIACIALGVMVITGVGALSDALRGGLAKQGETLLGGDLTFARVHARATPTDRARLATLGRVSETATLRTMARKLDGSEQALAELKAVDDAYPLIGAVQLEGAPSLSAAVQTGRSAEVSAPGQGQCGTGSFPSTRRMRCPGETLHPGSCWWHDPSRT